MWESGLPWQWFCGRDAAILRPMRGKRLTPEGVNREVLRLLSAGKQPDAEKLLEQYVMVYTTNQRVLFLMAACTRSRFMVRDAYVMFAAVAKINPDTVEGQCARYLMKMDRVYAAGKGGNLGPEYYGMIELADTYSSDPILRWMLGVECRAHGWEREGVKHYAKLLQVWDPGPAVAHQTYANMLDARARYKESLKHRKLAVKLEPSGWTYDGLAGTLVGMRKFKKANKAFEKAVELRPDSDMYWSNWAICLFIGGSTTSVWRSVRRRCR